MHPAVVIRYNPGPKSAPKQSGRVLFTFGMSSARFLQCLTVMVLLGIFSAVGAIGPRAYAQTGASEAPVQFDIPEQPLGSALAQYFSVTGVQILYDSALAAGHRSNRVKGRFTPRDALRQLLNGTGLIVRYSRADVATITAPSGTGQAPLVPLGRVVVREEVAPVRLMSVERLAYYGLLEDELHALLQASESTQRLSFSLTVHLSIAADGSVNTIAIPRSSGDSRTDALVTQALGQAIVSPPPADLQQPLAIVLRGLKSGHRQR